MARWGLIVVGLVVACRHSSSPSASDAGASPAPSGWSKTALAGANIVSTVAVDPKDPSRVFAGVAAGSTDQGFFRTRNGGKSWEKLGGGLPVRYAGLVAVGPRSGTILVNPGVEGIWRSTNRGDTFARVAADPGGPNALYFHPSTNMVWAVTSQQGCFRSGDDGATWARTKNAGLPLNQFGLGPFAFDGTKLYLGTGGKGVYTSSDNGDSWSKAPSSGLPESAEALAMVTNVPGTLFVETTHAGLFRSTDGAATFAKLDAATRYQALALDPSNPQVVFASAAETTGGPGGLLKTTNGGQKWTPIGPSNVPIQAATVASDGTLYVGTTGQGVWRLDGS